MTLLRRHRFAMLTAAVGLAGAALTSSAHAALRSPDAISSGVTAMISASASGTNGDVVVGWMSDFGLQARVRPAGGTWEPVVAQLSAPTNRTYMPDFVVDPDGNVTAIWSENTPTGGMFPAPGPNTVFTARRPAGGNWQSPEALSVPNVAGNNPQLELLPDNGVVALWTESGALKTATRSATGAWGASEAVGANTSETPSLTVDASGNITVAIESGSHRVAVLTHPAGGAWSAPVQVSSTTGSGLQRLVTTKDGDSALVWFDLGGSDVWASRRATINGSWTPEVLLTGSAGMFPASISTDEEGNVVAAWPAGGNIVVATRDASGTWTAPASLDAAALGYPAIATGPDGTTTLAWSNAGGGSNPVRYATLPNGGAWSAPADVTGLTNGFLTVSVDGTGDPIVASTTSGTVTVVGSDNSGPQLRNLSIPATAAAGATVNFSVSPLDTWSALGATTWDFGDGGSATGTSVSHQFTTAGTKTVTVKSKDALNNETTRTGSITIIGGVISQPPTPEPPTTDDPPAPPVPPTPTDPGKPSDPATPVAPEPEAPCVSRRVVKLNFKVPAGLKARRITLSVSGQKTRTLPRTARSAKVDMRGMPSRTVTAKVKLVTKGGKVVTDTRTYRTCS